MGDVYMCDPFKNPKMNVSIVDALRYKFDKNKKNEFMNKLRTFMLIS